MTLAKPQSQEKLINQQSNTTLNDDHFVIKRQVDAHLTVEPETQYLLDLIDSKLKVEHKIELEDYTTFN